MKKSLPKTIKDVEEVRIETDLLIIGGGNSGCLLQSGPRKRIRVSM